MSIRTELIDALRSILNNGPANAGVGICDNLLGEGLRAYETFSQVKRRLYATWPNWSGCPVYPVPHHRYMPHTGHHPNDVEYWADRAYHRLDHWTGKQLLLRRGLLWHCIKELRSMTDSDFNSMVADDEYCNHSVRHCTCCARGAVLLPV